MGIKYFFQNMEVGTVHPISDFRGYKIAIDASIWLYKGICPTKDELGLKHDITRCYEYFCRSLEVLFEHNISAVLVFDGNQLPLKEKTVRKRREKREKILARINELRLSGKHKEANKLKPQAIKIYHQMVYDLQKALTEKYKEPQLFCMMAPYEADAQLAYLEKIDFVNAIMTEDSDLMAYGASKVLYKWKNIEKNGGTVNLFEFKNLMSCKNPDLSSFTKDQIIEFLILAGCDYLSNIRGKGWKKIYSVYAKKRDLSDVINNFQNVIPENYLDDFYCAYTCFKYQKIFCPKDKIVKSFSIGETKDHDRMKKVSVYKKDFNFLGENLPPNIGEQIAYFKIHPVTRTSYDTSGVYKIDPIRRQNLDSEKSSDVKKKITKTQPPSSTAKKHSFLKLQRKKRNLEIKRQIKLFFAAQKKIVPMKKAKLNKIPKKLCLAVNKAKFEVVSGSILDHPCQSKAEHSCFEFNDFENNFNLVCHNQGGALVDFLPDQTNQTSNNIESKLLEKQSKIQRDVSIREIEDDGSCENSNFANWSTFYQNL